MLRQGAPDLRDFGEQAGITENSYQQIIKIVGDSSRHHTETFQAGVLANLLLALTFPFLGQALLGNVTRGSGNGFHLAIGI